MLEKGHEMFQFDLLPVRQILFFRPCGELAEQRRVSFHRVVRLPALVAQVLQKIFNERLHVTRIAKAAHRPHDETTQSKAQCHHWEFPPCAAPRRTSARFAPRKCLRRPCACPIANHTISRRASRAAGSILFPSGRGNALPATFQTAVRPHEAGELPCNPPTSRPLPPPL